MRVGCQAARCYQPDSRERSCPRLADSGSAAFRLRARIKALLQSSGSSGQRTSKLVARRAVEDENARRKPAWQLRPSWFVRDGGLARAPGAVEADALMQQSYHCSEVVLRAGQAPGQALDTSVTECIKHGISVLISSGPVLPVVAPCSTIPSSESGRRWARR